MNKYVIFIFKSPVTLAGDPINGQCCIRITQELPKCVINLSFYAKQYSKLIQKRKLPNVNPNSIQDKQVEKIERIQVSMDSPQKNQKQKKYELNGNVIHKIIRQYGVQRVLVSSLELFKGQVNIGDYKFFFSIPTNESMQSSFFYTSQDGLKSGKCSYKITLQIQNPDESLIILKESAEVNINARVQSSIEIQRQSDANIISYFCLSGGIVDLKIQLNKSNFTPGELAIIQYHLDNTFSSKPVTRVEIRLINKLIFIDDDQIDRVILNQVVFSKILPGANQGERLEAQIAKFEIPKNLKASVKNQTILNQYLLQIEAIIDQLFIKLSNPILCQIPINIQESRFQQVVNLDGWNFVPILNASVNAFSTLTVQQSFIPT
ncbi:unnamed protein product (macronuclear) [Paramecium tetraurelia]|uniref:Arrestin C-terminal-like domain-containing protein n=1 Tax=Paramecium tetraurelia TaxID=5888 RepID=A0D2Y0_PARTE|nr:uncharacterized protein GSPATT00012882001 [Paramecium tetraurelia]CAK77397.1 unnamed protein product [Paramecium tetraurelia]|eukprot:XP_001444794.1 hypothetical protein (macronuclear) [Paramecium tetraurelia strain d4-2]